MNNFSFLHRNPYFEDEPTLFYCALKILAGFNTIVTGICFYAIAFKSPPFLSKNFIRLILYHFTIGNITLITLSTLAIPIFLLPYTSVKFVGPYNDLGVPVVIQAGIDITLILITASTVVPLFYYRMDIILPREHILNSIYLRYSMYALVYGIVPTVPTPIYYFVTIYEDQVLVKQRLLQEFGVYYDDFMSKQVMATRLDTNPFAYGIFYAIVFFSVFSAIAVVGCSYVIIHLTSKVGVIGSSRYKAQQRELFLSLTAVFIPVMGIIVPIMATMMVTNSYRTDIFNLVITCGMSGIPVAFSSYVLTYGPYRRFLFRIFKKNSTTSVGNSTVFAVSRGAPTFKGII